MIKRQNKLQVDYTFKDIYKAYKKDILPELQFDEVTYKRIFKDFMKRSREAILTERETLELPHLGSFRIKKIKQSYRDTTRLRVDFALSKKLGFRVYHLNENRDGYYYRWYWNKKVFRNNRLRSFQAARTNTRYLASLLQRYTKNQLDYAE